MNGPPAVHCPLTVFHQPSPTPLWEVSTNSSTNHTFLTDFRCLCTSAVLNISCDLIACFWPMRVMGKIKRWFQQFAVVNQNYVSKLTALAEEWLRLYWAVLWNWFAQVSAFCNLSCKKLWEVVASLPGRFLSRHCFTWYMTMEVEPSIVKQYKCHHCCSGKNTRERGWRVEKKGLCIDFWLTRRLWVHGKNVFWGIL